MDNKNKILAGEIVAAQGLRGEVRVQTFTQSPNDFTKLKVESEEFHQNEFKFVRALPNSSIIIAKIKGIDDRNAAESLRGTQLFINRDALPALPDGEFYHADLIGLMVEQNKVIAVHNFGAGDILELDNGEMVSFSGAQVDLKNKNILLRK
jgi:16S rRNA processing protein RimM